MKFSLTLAAVIVLGAIGAAQTSATPSAAPAPSQQGSVPAASSDSNASALVIGAVLTKTIDAKKIKEGDEVVAKTLIELKSADGTVIPRNSKITGHVTHVQARGKGQDQSVLAIAFDKLQGKDKELPFHAVIQAVAPPQPIAALASDSGSPGPSSSGTSGSMGGASGAAGASNNSTSRDNESPGAIGSNAGADSNSGAAVGNSADPGASFNANSKGAIGMKNIQLAPAASGSAQESMLISTSSNVRLESGTRLVLKVTPQ